jgi:CHAT domain-containing protein
VNRKVTLLYGRAATTPLCRVVVLVCVVAFAAACRSTPPGMSLDEAKQVTASVTGGSFVAPPRTIDDLVSFLTPPITTFHGLTIVEEHQRPEYVGVLYWRRGNAARRAGQFAEAIRDFKRASELVTPEMMIDFDGRYQGGRRSEDWGNVGLDTLRDLALTEAEAGDYQQAIRHLRAAEAVSVRVRRDAFPLYVWSDLVDMYAAIGDLQAVDDLVASIRRLHSRAQAWRTNPADRLAMWDSNAAAAEATLMEMRGRLTDAEALWRRSIDVLRTQEHAGGGWIAERFDARIGRLALCLMKQGRLLEAEAAARQSVVQTNRRGAPRAHGTVKAFMILGRVLREQGRYAEAERIVRAAIAYHRHGGASAVSSFAVAEPGLELARVLAGARQWEAAIQQYESVRAQLQDEALYRRLTQRDPMIAIALLRTGRLAEAAPIVAAALDASVTNLGLRHITTAEWRALNAMVLARRGDRSRALPELQESAAILLEQPSGGDESATAGERAQRRAWLLTEYVDLLTRADAHDGVRPRDRAIAEAFRLADGARAGTVQRALGAALARVALVKRDLQDLARREQDAATQIAALQAVLVAADGYARAKGDVSSQIEALQRAREALLREIEQRFPSYAEFVSPRPTTIERVRGALRPKEALIAVLVGDDRTYVWAVPKVGQVAFAVSPMGAAALEASVGGLRAALDSGARALGDIPPFNLAIAHELYRQLLQPVRSGWESADTLLVVAHGALAQIPWTILPTRAVTLGPERSPLFSNYRAIPWLGRSHAVTIIPSVGTLATLRALPPGDARRRPFVGFGDPYFSVGQAEGASSESVGRAATLSRHDGMALREVSVSPDSNALESRFARLPRLPDTAEEIRAIAQALGADEGDVFLGISANERTVKRVQLDRYRVVAFATHGLAPGDHDGLTQPALALTAPEVAKVEGDGLLTVEKILGLRLNADWVVLSACNTANGAGTGAEAISGLGKAFFYAGARALLVTFWPVETTSAKTLTTELFRRQAADPRLTRAKALQQTINTLIDEGGMINPATGEVVFSYAHPMFWAPFVLVGDGG